MNTLNTFNNCGTVLYIINGSGNIDASLDTNASIYSTVNGSGDITLTGNSSNQNITIIGSGNVHSFAFDTYHSVVNISGSSSCELAADSTLNVTISGSGDIYYKGHPAITSNIT